MPQKRRVKIAPTSEDLLDLQMEDFVPPGIVDPARRRIALEHGLLKWTPYFERKKERAFNAK
jgi:hypothetical protein